MHIPYSPLLFRSIGMGLWLLATAAPADILTVTTNADSGAGSLRQVISDAASGDTIEFDTNLNGNVITLTSGQLIISKNLAIRGPGPGQLVIDGNASSRIFGISPGTGTTQVSLSGLSITNGAASIGGGIYSATAWNTPMVILSVSNCLVRANQATDPSGSYTGGGGIAALRNTQLYLTDCTIDSNSANANGGGVWVYSQTHIERCLFVENTTSSSGGGLTLRDSGPLTIVNSTFSGNASFFSGWQTDFGGGALYTVEKANISIYNSTFTANTTTRRCGGILSRGTTKMHLHSTIVAGNSDNQGYPDVSGVFSSVTNSLIQVTNDVSLPGTKNIFGQAAQLEALADNGGPTRTHALRKTSPAIDKGYNPLNLATDQRGTGYPRLSGTAVDIGAYEFPIPPGGTVVLVR